MPLRFHRQIKLGEHVKLNLNKKSASFSVGIGGLHLNIGPRGPLLTFDFPGASGLSYRKRLGKWGSDDDKAAQQAAPLTTPQLPAAEYTPEFGPHTMGEVPPLAENASPQEAAFHVAASSYTRGEYEAANRTFAPLIDSQFRDDARYMTAITASYLGQYDEAIQVLADLLEQGQPPLPGDEGSLVTKFLGESSIRIPITQFSGATLPLDMSVALFLLSELLQLGGDVEGATEIMADVFRRNPDYRLAQLALADLTMQAGRYDDLFNLFANSTPELKAEDNASLEFLYYWAVALTTKGLYDAANQVYKRALSKKKGLDPDLLRLVRYGRADLYERMGKRALARRYFEELLAENPMFFDVVQRIEALKQTAKKNG